MAVDAVWIDTVLATEDIAERETLSIDGVDCTLPAGRTRRRNDWQRRVLDDILPDSPNADAPEKTPNQIIYNLTDLQQADETLSDALAPHGELAPLRPLFLFETKGKASIPVAFHVLATKAVSRPIKSRSFTDRTFLLLMRDDGGTLDVELLKRFLEYFRAPIAALDLAQQTVLQRLQPDWSADEHHSFVPPDGPPVTPFLPKAGRLLRRDIGRLLDAGLGHAEFFQYVNRLLALHLGLYQSRLAAVLNPSVDAILQELASPGSVSVADVARMEQGDHFKYRFEGSLWAQAPAGGVWRSVGSKSRPYQAYRDAELELVKLHYTLLLLNRIRELARDYLMNADRYDSSSAENVTRLPSEVVRRIHEDEGFRRFMDRGMQALAVRFVLNQVAGTSRDRSLEEVRSAQSGGHALKRLYHRYDRESSPSSSTTRAWKQGAQVLRLLLSARGSDLLQIRRGVGAYFEIGAGLLPLLLITTIEPGRQKLPVHRFWSELEGYGIGLEAEEREGVLDRLKAMGLFERFSDAGTASYVRSMLLQRHREDRA
ncbi:MAG: DNA phosphorothioation-dependent restriction protein DptG [Sandaracinaceae bacterium]|nr:DNA phosphorothioation-dependent restriction protein DptG [Sandaracinaceae bacterium]